MPRLAIQVIPYKSSTKIQPLLESLKQQTFRDFEMFFYDNSEVAEESTKTKALVEASGLPATYVIAEKNIGFAGANQKMFEMHSDPLVMLLNDDAYLDSRYLEEAVRRLESNPKIASVTGLVYRDASKTSVDTSGLDYRCLGKIVDLHDAPQTDREVYGVSGAVGMYRRSAVEQVGGMFDPTWFMYKEDADLAIRLRKAGFIAWYEPKAVAFHTRGIKEDGGGFLSRLKNERRRPRRLRNSSYINQWRIYRRHFRPSIGLKDMVQTIVTEIGRTILFVLAS